MIRALDIGYDAGRIIDRFSREPGMSFLDSALNDNGLGDWSIVACRPYAEIRGNEKRTQIIDSIEERRVSVGLIEYLENAVEAKSARECDPRFPFMGGAIGYLEYEYGYGIERSLAKFESPEDGCRGRFRLYSCALLFEHEKGILWAVTQKEGKEGEAELDWLESVARDAAEARLSGFSVGALSSNFSRAEYVAAVERIREYIRNGDVYQVNLSQRFEGTFSGSTSALYSSLRQVNPAPYSAYLKFDDEDLVSSSPECLFRARGSKVSTRPIKGTRPRCGDVLVDQAMVEDLRLSEKDRAELLMIVDLERNDLGRVCRPGSISVSDLFGIEAYAKVFHQTASVVGELESDVGPVSAMKAVFPGGSISGAPKIRAMEIIREFERERRGIYTGSIGYASVNGNVDFNIAIRTLRIANGSVSFSVGGGIVWDSDPDSEYEETMHKAEALFLALKGHRDD